MLLYLDKLFFLMNRVLFLLLLSFGLAAQSTIVSMPIDGSTDTTSECSGILVDGGGINGNYTSYNNGYVVINPPGNDTVSLSFTNWNLYHGSDYVQIYDGAGLSGSTYLGYYSGSSSTLPNNGNPILGASGALTIRFYTNYYGNASGFVASWSTSSSSTPTANCAYSAPNQNYNIPIQFVNTSSNAGEYYWDFGDGTISTEENPSHAFTSPGINTVTLVATNCNASDTTTISINISSAPSLLAFTNPINMNVPCGTIHTEYWTLSNDTGAGPLTANVEVFDTSGSEHIHFDNDLEGATMLSGSASLTRSTVAAQGTHSLRVTSASSTEPVSIPVADGGPGFQPTYFSYRTRANTSGYRACKFQMSSGNSTNPSILGYTFWYSDGRLGIRRKTLSGYLGFEYVSNSLGNWTHIEYRNIDWSTETFDMYINGVYYDSFSFLNPTSNTQADYVSYLRLVNDYSSDVSFVDDIRIGYGSEPSRLTVSPSSTVVLAGNSSTFSLEFDATGLAAGSYTSYITVQSNDTLINLDTIPVNINVIGGYEFTPQSDTIQLGLIPTGQNFIDSLRVQNTGCSLLEVDSIRVNSTNLSATLTNIQANDTAYLDYSFNAPLAGVYLDSIEVFTPDSSFVVYLSAQAYDAASIKLDSSIFNISVSGCPDSVVIPFWIYNDGQQPLNYQMDAVSANSTASCMFTIQLTDSYGDGWNGALVDLLDSDGNVLYTMGSSFYTGYTYTQSVMLCSGDTYSIVVTATGSYKSEIGLNVIENGTVIASYTNTSATNLGTQMASFGANCGVPCANPSDISFNPANDTITSGDSQLVYMSIYSDSLIEGYYQYTAYINSNDPIDSSLTLLVNLTLDGESETFINRSSCFDLDTLIQGSVTYDTLYVANLGCDSLSIGTIYTSSNAISAVAVSSSIAILDSDLVVVTIQPTTFGPLYDTVFIVTSDTTWPVCYSGYIDASPSAWANTNAINVSTQNCGDSASFNIAFGNSAFNTNLNWTVSSGEVLNVLLVNSNVYPTLWSNFQNYMATVEDVDIKVVTSTSAIPNELGWADLVIFPPITNSSVSSDYTSIQNDMSSWINDGGKMLIMGSTYVDNILDMNFITGYYYGNYTNYTHYVNSSYSTHPYIQGVSSSFVPQSAVLDAYIYNSGYVYLVYNTYYRQALSYFPLGDGEVIYYGFNFNTVYPDITKILDNIFESTLSEKATGINWLTFDLTTGNTLGGDTSVVIGTAHADTLAAGVYNLNITISTNDPSNPVFSIPVNFTVNGQGESLIDSSCLDFGPSYQNVMHTKDVPVYNAGCDTLYITSAATAGNSFTTGSVNLNIAPGDTGYIAVSLYQSTLGSVSDTLSIYSTVDTVHRCLTATIVGASDISVSPSSMNIIVNKCNGFATVPYTISNNGQAQLSYYVDVVEVYDSSYTQSWLYTAPNYSNSLGYTFNNIIDSDTIFYEIILNGEYSQTSNYFYLYANGAYIQTLYDNNVNDYSNDTISGYITGGQASTIVNAGYLTIQLYSYNHNSVSGQSCLVHVWQKEDVAWASPIGVSTGTLSVGATISKSILVTVSNLALGTYNASVIFETNDPGDPTYQVPLIVHVVSEPDMSLSTTALNFGSVYSTVPVVDSILIENDGCTDLSIGNITSTNSHFVSNWTQQTIAPGASQWLHITFTATNSGVESGILTIFNNDSLQVISLLANVVFAPTADFQFQIQNACDGSVSFNNESSNGSQYFWDFGDGQFSGAVNPQHTYNKPGTYSVMLVTSNSGGSDTTFKTVILNDVLYVASEFPDTVQAGTTVQFIDSSMYANSWQWYFGDGNNSTTPNPQHTYQNKGTFIVTLLVTNSAGCSGSTNNAIIVTSGIGIREQALEAALYPNPTSGSLHIECSAAERIILHSSTGAQILDIPFVEDLDLSNLPAGSYQFVLRGNSGLWRETISVVR